PPHNTHQPPPPQNAPPANPDKCKPVLVTQAREDAPLLGDQPSEEGKNLQPMEPREMRNPQVPFNCAPADARQTWTTIRGSHCVRTDDSRSMIRQSDYLLVSRPHHQQSRGHPDKRDQYSQPERPGKGPVRHAL